MLMVMSKWHVQAVLSSGKTVQVWISENYIGNVLQAVARMSFDANPLVSVDKLTVELQQRSADQQVGVFVNETQNEVHRP